jgi:hypothetical protein
LRALVCRQLGDGLTDITVVVDDLCDREADAKQVMPMLAGVPIAA